MTAADASRQQSGPADDDTRRLDEIIAEYIRRTEAGEPIDREELLARHPDLANDLREFLADEDRFATLAEAFGFGPSVTGLIRPAKDSAYIGRFDQYEVFEVVGRGGMGVVLKCFDPKLHRVVAIKVLAPHLASDAIARKRFLREARAAAAVAHPHVVAIHAVHENAALPYLVMEYVSGISLQDRLAAEGVLPTVEILRIGNQIASGLAAAHAQGLVHRDIKPSNILLENGVQRVKITDFGLARAIDQPALTRTGETAGTPQYMSPEQVRAKSLDYRSDLFSLGCVLYAMCTGRSPFQAETTAAVLHRVCEESPRPVRGINPGIPSWLAETIDRLLAKEPAERFQTADEVADLLGRQLVYVQDGGAYAAPTLAASPPSREFRRGLRSREWLAAAVLIAVFIGGLSVLEANAVTGLTGTVLRLVTGEGTLVIEIDDPSIEVSIDGEEIRITGAGVKEVNLRPGQYQFNATKDGRPIKRELLTITRGGRSVVRVHAQAQAASENIYSESELTQLLVDGVERVTSSTIPGVVSIDRAVEVRTKVEGVVKSILEPEGSDVEKDDVLVVLDDELVRLRGQIAAMKYESSAKEVEKARQAENESKLDSAILESQLSRAQVRAAELALEHHRISAPMKGLVAQMYCAEVDTVKFGDAICRLVDMEQVRVDGELHAKEFDAKEVHGSRVAFEIDRGQIERFSGRIFARPVAKDGALQFIAIVTNRRTNGGWILRPGMRGRVILSREADDD